jgi:hypothetical protein
MEASISAGTRHRNRELARRLAPLDVFVTGGGGMSYSSPKVRFWRPPSLKLVSSHRRGLSCARAQFTHRHRSATTTG